MDIENEVVEQCHICGEPTLLICEICNKPYCEDCGAVYDQFSQVDFDCCSVCKKTDFE